MKPKGNNLHIKATFFKFRLLSKYPSQISRFNYLQLMILINGFGDKVENDNLNLYFGMPATSVQGNYSALIPRLHHLIQFTKLLRLL